MINIASNIENLKSFKEGMHLVYNGLTVLPNKDSFEETLTIELNKSRKNKKGVVLLFIDSDSFSITNDILSFDNNYEFIKIVSNYFKIDDQNKGLMHRLNENKSVIALYDIDDIDHVKNNLKISFKNLEQLTEFTNDGIYNNGYVGISIYPEHGYISKELINNANIAMYKAKELGKNKYCFYEDSIYEEMAFKKEMTKDLRQALNNYEFIIHYQPQMDIKTNKICGVEALMRWNSSKYGYMPPNKFIPLAEESGLIIEMGKWILRESCIQAKKWQEIGLNI